MKKGLFSAVILLSLSFGIWSCSDTLPSYSGGSSPTPSPTPGGPKTITVTTGTSGASATGYIYMSSGFSTGAGGVLSMTANVGDTIDLPGSGTHPLYFDNGSSTCIYSGATSDQSYTFTVAGTYYFHCGNHATSCTNGNSSCGSTNCSAMAAVVTVN